MSSRLVSEVSQLRIQPSLFTIILGDFGREAATRYAGLLAAEERRHIAAILASKDLPFLDEYRRVMFSLVGDVAFLKTEMIDAAWEGSSRLSDRVLVAVRGNPVPLELIQRLALVIHDEAAGAAARGHTDVRVSLVCNALSDVLQQAIDLAVGPELETIASRFGYELRRTTSPMPSIAAHGVVQACLSEISHRSLCTGRPVLVLGAKMARELYAKWGNARGVETIEITAEQQSVIDDAVLLAIDGREAGLLQARQAIEHSVVAPHRRTDPDLIVLEACTDFDFGIGYDSIRLMASALVRDAYTPRSPLGV